MQARESRRSAIISTDVGLECRDDDGGSIRQTQMNSDSTLHRGCGSGTVGRTRQTGAGGQHLRSGGSDNSPVGRARAVLGTEAVNAWRPGPKGRWGDSQGSGCGCIHGLGRNDRCFTNKHSDEMVGFVMATRQNTVPYGVARTGGSERRAVCS